MIDEINELMTFTYGIKLHVWGDYACFTRPELKSERMSYEVITPSAARGILSAIYWKPEFNWVVDRVHVLAPINFTQVRRNELGSKIVAPSKAVMTGDKQAKLGIFIEEERQQRASTLLCNVSYVIEAHVELAAQESGANSVAKHLEMFKRRARKGQCFHSPCLGTRELMAMFDLIEDEASMPASRLPDNQRNRGLGLMLHDMLYHDCAPKTKGAIEIVDHEKSSADKRCYKKVVATPQFFMAELVDGVMSVPPLNQSLS